MDISSSSDRNILDRVNAWREDAMVSKDQLKIFNGTIVTVLFIVLLSVYGLSRRMGKANKLLPPGPRPLPLVGNLFLLGERTHQALAQLAKQYGNIMTLYFGSARVVVVSDAVMAKELYSVSDANFASRPIHSLMKTSSKKLKLSGEEVISMGITTYNPKVREMRQLCISELFTAQKLEIMKSVRFEELQRMMATFKDLAMRADGGPVKIRSVVSEYALRSSCRTVFNKAFLHSEGLPKSESSLHPEAFRKWEEVNGMLLAEKNIADIIPLFRILFGSLDLQGVEARWTYVTKLKLGWTTSVVEWYQQHPRSENVVGEPGTDFADTLLNLGEAKYSTTAIKSFLSELLGAGADTTGTTLEWMLLELARHPQINERLQKEVDAKFGMLRPVQEDEAAQLPYLQAFVKEVLRLHPPAVLAIPHCNTEDAMLGGYHIPAGTAVIPNLWAIQRDPKAWGEDASVFNPDRFLGSDLNVNGTSYQFLPFGAGRRICPGRPLAMRALYAAAGSFVHAFEWSAPPGVELNANEGTNGLNIRTEHPLFLRISLRPAAALYQLPPKFASTWNT
ncbi:hypothetical protein M758_12G074800 [Ceratodon purpureus]|nr:hypothetical protein M758_12G074800 [Ceratodon purpureus]